VSSSQNDANSEKIESLRKDANQSNQNELNNSVSNSINDDNAHCIVDSLPAQGLAVCEHPHKGRILRATKSFNKGSIILCEPPLVHHQPNQYIDCLSVNAKKLCKQYAVDEEILSRGIAVCMLSDDDFKIALSLYAPEQHTSLDKVLLALNQFDIDEMCNKATKHLNHDSIQTRRKIRSVSDFRRATLVYEGQLIKLFSKYHNLKTSTAIKQL
jgi:hypothetical protein